MALQGFEFDKWAKEVVFSGKPGFLFFFFFFSSQQTPNRNLWLVMDVRSESGEEGAVRGEGSHQS